MASSTVENYLKHILLLGEAQADGLVPMGHLATALAVVPGTVTTMVKALASAGLVRHRPRHGVRLTETGRRAALDVLRKHRLLETFLVNVLKMDWADVPAEADRLEHAISDVVLDRLDSLLGFPTTDPHGDPIPSRAGRIDSEVYSTLATCATAGRFRVRRVVDQSTAFLNFAERRRLLPGANVRIVRRDLTSGIVVIKRAHGRPLALSLLAAANFHVEPIHAEKPRRA